MVNRQARREQSRTTRTNRGGGGARRPTGGNARGPQRGPASSGGGPGDFISRPFVLIVGAVIIAAIAVIAIVIATGGGGSDDDLATSLEEAHANFASVPAEMIDGAKVGSDDAPIKLVAFEDFQCPFCLLYTAEDEPMIIEEYVKTGKLQLEFRHLPILGTESLNAAKGSECAADQNRFWDYHNYLFTLQAREGQVSNEQLDAGRFTDSKLRDYAQELGLDVAAFDACYNDPDTLAKVNDDAAEARQRGITGTPNFVVNGQTAGSDFGNVENWRTQLDSIYDQVTASPTAVATGTNGTPATTSPSPASTTPPAATATP